MGFPCGSAVKESTCNCRRPGFKPWVGTIPWRRERLPTPVFWPGEFHELHSPWGHKQADRTQRLSLVTVLESQKHHVHKGRDWRENMCVQRGPCFSHWGHPSPQPRDQRWLCARPAPQRLLLEMVGHPGTSHRCGRARRRLGGTGGGDRALGE